MDYCIFQKGVFQGESQFAALAIIIAIISFLYPRVDKIRDKIDYADLEIYLKVAYNCNMQFHLIFLKWFLGTSLFVIVAIIVRFYISYFYNGLIFFFIDSFILLFIFVYFTSEILFAKYFLSRNKEEKNIPQKRHNKFSEKNPS